MQAFYFDTVDSTNEAARRLLREGRIGDFAYIAARAQSAGKGNRGHEWLSPADAGIYLTVVDHPAHPSGELRVFTQAAGVACVEVLREWTGLDVLLKPINDLYAEGRKLGGILTEAVIDKGAPSTLIIGVGINVRCAERALPPDHVQPVCLEELMPCNVFEALDFHRLTVAIARRIRRWNGIVSYGVERKIEEKWRKYSLHPDGLKLESGTNRPTERNCKR